MPPMQAIIYHPSILKTPLLSSLKMKAKLSLLVSLNHSMDPSLTEMKVILNDPALLSRNGISEECSGLFGMVDQRQPNKALKASIKKLRQQLRRRSRSGTQNCRAFR